MKIGILTVPFNNNYGGFLQAYALKTILAQMGHEVVFINRRRNLAPGYRAMFRRFFINMGVIHDEKEEIIKKLSVNTNEFIEQYLQPITEPFYTHKQLKRCLKLDFDCLIVGSDQVWRYLYAKGSIDDFFFSFANNTTPRFSYAASFGTDIMEYPKDKLQLCTELLKSFSGISVREESGITLLNKYMGVDSKQVKVVLDPTFLLNKQEYIQLFNKYPRKTSPYIFTYVLDESEFIQSVIRDLNQFTNLEILALKAQTGDLTRLEPIAPIEEWLTGIYNADYVITDSFHGMVFSIIFNKPFLVYGNSTRGTTRMKSVLEMFQLENRYIDDSANAPYDLMTQGIDWNRVNSIISEKKIESLSFLKKQLQHI